MVASKTSRDRSEDILSDLEAKRKTGTWTATVKDLNLNVQVKDDYLHSGEFVRKYIVFPFGNPAKTPGA